MIRQFELVDLVKAYNPDTDEALLNRAYVFGAKAHANQQRANGEPYFGHPLEVAKILTGLKLDDATIVTALLHDTVEDTDATRDQVQKLFGKEVAQLVDGVTKLGKLELSSKETAQAENFRKLLMAMSKDVRVLLVKLADRLHNMRTINFLRPEKRTRIARETMDIFAPLAGRMGMQAIRDELEDLSFAILNADARVSIMRRFLTLKKQTGDLIPRISEEIEAALKAQGVEAKVYGREKRPYAIWRKMEAKKVSFEQLSDIYGFRVITKSEIDCFRALGAMHLTWRLVPGRFKDYISGPKANGYRSIHTTVIGPEAMRVEIQIRTQEMHEVAETGVAAHWAYKDGKRAENRFAVDPFRWLRDLVNRFEKGDAPQEFLEHAKLEMFHDQVFCFTPTGDVVGLPKGATPIDFAYAIHTDIGDSCVGVKVNGQRVPLWTKLRNGQMVEIIRASAQRPSPVWEEMAFTGKAKSAIRRALRNSEREEHVALGRQIVKQAFARIEKDSNDKAMETAGRKLGCASVNDLLERVGAAQITGRQVVEAVYPSAPTDDGATPSLRPFGPPVRGVRRGAAVRMCEHCRPVPGDRIVGIAKDSTGVVVHAIDCPLLAEHEESLATWLDLRWDEDAAQTADHVARIDMALANEPGALGAVCALIGEQRANIDNIMVTDRKPDFFKVRVDLEVRDVKHLAGIVTALEAQAIVNDVARPRAHPADEAA